MRFWLLGVVLLSACNGLTACADEPDIGGSWAIEATPLGADAGVPTIPNAFSIDAELQESSDVNFLVGHWVYGTLTASDPSVFGKLTIPPLTHNDGSKTGAILGCKLQINVPIDMPVTDDDADDDGPSRINLWGGVVAKGVLSSASLDGSQVILVSDPTNTPRAFSWVGTHK